jgi:hypothetical protein
VSLSRPEAAAALSPAQGVLFLLEQSWESLCMARLFGPTSKVAGQGFHLWFTDAGSRSYSPEDTKIKQQAPGVINSLAQE